MEPIKFPEANSVLHPSGQSYSSNIISVKALHVWTDKEQCVSCWQLTWQDRLKALFYGKLWISVLFGETQPPICPIIDKTYFAQQ